MMDIDELYDAPLEQFVPRRGELARELRKQGKREEAAEVAGLRKPSVAAWAVNQLVRTQTRSVAELFEAGDELQEAHRTATAGRGDAGALRSATQRERSAVDQLVDAARGLLTTDGHELSPTIIDRVADTLRAAALDDEAREQVRHGRLERELRQVGLGVLAGGGAIQTPAAPAKRKAKQPAAKKGAKEGKGRDQEAEERQHREQRAEQERRERERNQALKAARDVEAKARRQAERTERALKLAQRLRDRAAEDLETAEQSLAEAQADFDEANAELGRARDELENI